MNTNTKFPCLPNPLYPCYNKHGTIHSPLQIQNGLNKTHQESIVKETTSESSSEIYEHYNDKSSNEIIYEEKPTMKIVQNFQNQIENVFDLSKFLKK